MGTHRLEALRQAAKFAAVQRRTCTCRETPMDASWVLSGAFSPRPLAAIRSIVTRIRHCERELTTNVYRATRHLPARWPLPGKTSRRRKQQKKKRELLIARCSGSRCHGPWHAGTLRSLRRGESGANRIGILEIRNLRRDLARPRRHCQQHFGQSPRWRHRRLHHRTQGR